jgi:poly-gamma-glutamate capsule biosynthesis protein CapA/YwtB (metallophosphatase superfamily)
VLGAVRSPRNRRRISRGEFVPQAAIYLVVVGGGLTLGGYFAAPSTTPSSQADRRLPRSSLVEFGRRENDTVLGEASLRRKLYALAAAATVLISLLGSCSPEPSEGQAGEDRRSGESRGAAAGGSQPEEAAETPEGPSQPEPERPLVPITHLTSTRESVSKEDLSQNRELAVPQDFTDSAEQLLGGSGFRSFDSAGAVVDRVSRNPGALGLVPWDEVGPWVKALGVDGESLLVPGAAPEDYALSPEAAPGPDPDELRRVVVGGDIVLDRGQNYMVIQQGMGLDFPLDGGYAAITSRVSEPSYYSETGVIHQFTAERLGRSGAVQRYLMGADMTLANLENPVIREAVWHPEATTFTGDLRLLPVLEEAGIDGVTLGNNHILDAGTSGLRETMAHLDDASIAHAGAGMDLAEAREPMIFELGGTKVGVLSYQGVPSYDWAWATETAPGTAPLLTDVMREDVERLRTRVDLVVVSPHWGKEYIATPEPWQVEFAHAAVEAGADIFVGGHAHWPKGMEVYEGKPIFYGVGNFLFDQSWSEETSTGIFAEIILYEDRVIQVRPVPFILLNYAQPNFLTPKGGGNRALRRIYSASLGPEFRSDGTHDSSGDGPNR